VLDQRFGVWTRNEHVGRHLETAPEEITAPENVGDGLPFSSPHQQRADRTPLLFLQWSIQI
jgi:hypothetical protein